MICEGVKLTVSRAAWQRQQSAIRLWSRSLLWGRRPLIVLGGSAVHVAFSIGSDAAFCRYLTPPRGVAPSPGADGARTATRRRVGHSLQLPDTYVVSLDCGPEPMLELGPQAGTCPAVLFFTLLSERQPHAMLLTMSSFLSGLEIRYPEAATGERHARTVKISRLQQELQQ